MQKILKAPKVLTDYEEPYGVEGERVEGREEEEGSEGKEGRKKHETFSCRSRKVEG